MTLDPFIKEECREFNTQPAPSTQEWEAASKLFKLLKPLWEMSVFFEGEKYPTLCSISRLITTLNSAFANAGPPPFWNLEVQNWNHLPAEVFECYLLLKSGFQT